MSIDSRGVQRGSCSACGCGAYDGGSAKKKCVSCGHPPGKHQNLSSAPSNLGASLSSVSLSSSSSNPLAGSAVSFTVGVPNCPVSGCTNNVFFDVNTSQEYPCCRDHVSLALSGQLLSPSDSDSGIFSPGSAFDSSDSLSSTSGVTFLSPTNDQQPQLPSSGFSSPAVVPLPPAKKKKSPLQQTAVPVLPPGQQCKLEGCTRPKYIENDGKQHDFCGRSHALLYDQEQAQLSGTVLSSDLKCKTPGCPLQRRLMDDGSGYFDYCSIACRNSQQRLTLVPNLGLTTAADGSDTCSLPGCNLPKYVDPANGRVHDYCGRTHASQAQQQVNAVAPATSLGIQRASTQEFTTVQTKFQQNWATRKGPCPNVDFVFVVTDQNLQQRFQTYRQGLTNQKIEEHYHGTKLTCDITNTGQLCTDLNCGVCGISQNGFDRRCIQNNINFQRFGHGFYLAPNSSKCHDYTQGANGYRAMLLCDVCPGNKYTITSDNQSLTGPPQGFDSIYGQAGPGCSLNYEEIVLHNPDAILPKYIVVYQKNGIGKIAS